MKPVTLSPSYITDNHICVFEYCSTLSAAEKRLLALGLPRLEMLKTDRRVPASPGFTLCAEDWEGAFAEEENPWEAVKKTVNALHGHVIRMPSKPKRRRIVGFVSCSITNDNTGDITVSFNEAIAPLIVDMAHPLSQVMLPEPRECA